MTGASQRALVKAGFRMELEMGTIPGVRARVWRECSGMESPAQDVGTGSILDISGKFVVGLGNAVVLGFTGS